MSWLTDVVSDACSRRCRNPPLHIYEAPKGKAHVRSQRKNLKPDAKGRYSFTLFEYNTMQLLNKSDVEAARKVGEHIVGLG